MRVAWLALCALCLWSCEAAQEAPGQAQEEAPSVRSRLEIAPAEAAQEAAVVTLPAEVVLPPRAALALGPPMAGRLLRWEVSPGDAVEEGAALAELQSLELSDLKAAEQEAARVVQERLALLEARRRGVEGGFREVSQVEEARAGLGEARARLEALRKQLQMRHGGADGRWIWRAPQAGVVEEVRCSPGGVASPEATCLRLLDPRQAELEVRVPERYLGQLGEAPTATWAPRGALGPQGGLRLVRRGAALRASDRTRSLSFRPQGEPVGWLPGMTGRATLTVAAAGLLRVPTSAVTQIDGRHVLFVWGEEAQARLVAVTLRGRSGDQLLVEAPGLKAGDPVVTRGAFLLKSLHLLSHE
jgi:RND family efflux transporter MFP subunit